MRMRRDVSRSRVTATGFAWLALVIALPYAGLASTAGGEQWTRHTDPESGISLSYPAALFPEMTETDEGWRFTGPDAEIEVSARDDIGVRSTDELRDLIINAEGYSSLTYSPGGTNWMVASGYRGPDVYYEKFFVRGGKVRAFSIRYPKAARHIYDAVVERVEDDFRPW